MIDEFEVLLGNDEVSEDESEGDIFDDPLESWFDDTDLSNIVKRDDKPKKMGEL